MEGLLRVEERGIDKSSRILEGSYRCATGLFGGVGMD